MILGLHGKMGSGKNEVARRLALLLRGKGLPLYEVSFAAKLKQSAAALLGCTVDDLEAWKNDPEMWVCLAAHGGYDVREGQTVRSFLQRYGTEAHREVFGEDFWLDAALPLDRDYSGGLYVVTDVRFPNEAERVRHLGGTVVHIVGQNEDTGSHASERSLHCFYEIDNRIRDDDFASLDKQLIALLGTLIVTLNNGRS